jgi:hypothetical protein
MNTSNIKVYYLLTSEFDRLFQSAINADKIREWQSQDSLSEQAKSFVDLAVSKDNVYDSLQEFMYDLNYGGEEFLDFYYFYTDAV